MTTNGKTNEMNNASDPEDQNAAEELPPRLKSLEGIHSVPAVEHPERFQKVLDDLTRMLEDDLP